MAENGEHMCFTEKEKEHLFHQLDSAEHKAENASNKADEAAKKADRHETTINVAIAVSSIFIAAFIAIAIWYLNTLEKSAGNRDAAIGKISTEVQAINASLVRLETQVEFANITMTGHISSPRNHPDNTARVDRLIEDVRQLNQELNGRN